MRSVKIGRQEWMADNLDVGHYRSGDPIPEQWDPGSWKNLTSGAWSCYDSNPANATKYGKLYSWFAVTDPRGLPPKGWRFQPEWM